MPKPEVAPDFRATARRWLTAVEQAGGTDREALIAELADDLRRQADHHAEGRFDAIYQRCPAGVVLADPDGVISAANPALLRLARVRNENDLIGTRAEDLGADERDRSALRAAVEAGDGSLDRIAIRSGSAPARFVQVTITTMPGGNARHPILMIEDKHELQQLQETFQHQGLHDPLTGLPNGVHFRSKLETMLAGHEHPRIALLFLDIDGFKVVNDGLGADVADLVLRGVAGILREVFSGHQGFVARLFGDGFAVALPGELDPGSVTELAERAIQELAKPRYVEDVGVGVSVSIGIAIGVVPGTGHDSLMRSAEVALHRAKELGKAQWVMFDAETGRADRGRYRIASAIAGALELGEITVAYQPHVVLPAARVVTSLNAALVWDHPVHGRLRDGRFYPLAEITGMTVSLGKYLLAEALRTKADWQNRFGDDAPMVCLTLPRRMAIDVDLVGIVRTELTRAGLVARHLMLCTDAAALLDGRGDLLESLGLLAQLGVRFIITVTGIPDLEILAACQVRVPAVMLTGPLVSAFENENPPAWAHVIVHHLVARAEELGMKVGAYGVASRAHADRLFDLGIVVGSGSYLPEYLSRADAEIWIGKAFPMN